MTTNQIRDRRRPDSRPRRGFQVLASHLHIPAITVLLPTGFVAGALTITTVSRSLSEAGDGKWPVHGSSSPSGSSGDIGSSESAQAQMARLVSAAMILDPDRVLDLGLSSSYREGYSGGYVILQSNYG